MRRFRVRCCLRCCLRDTVFGKATSKNLPASGIISFGKNRYRNLIGTLFAETDYTGGWCRGWEIFEVAFQSDRYPASNNGVVRFGNDRPSQTGHFGISFETAIPQDCERSHTQASIKLHCRPRLTRDVTISIHLYASATPTGRARMLAIWPRGLVPARPPSSLLSVCHRAPGHAAAAVPTAMGRMPNAQTRREHARYTHTGRSLKCRTARYSDVRLCLVGRPCQSRLSRVPASLKEFRTFWAYRSDIRTQKSRSGTHAHTQHDID